MDLLDLLDDLMNRAGWALPAISLGSALALLLRLLLEAYRRTRREPPDAVPH